LFDTWLRLLYSEHTDQTHEATGWTQLERVLNHDQEAPGIVHSKQPWEVRSEPLERFEYL
jgi:hypothetical protein